MTELKPCPFCGSKNIKPSGGWVQTPMNIFVYIHCFDCDSASRKIYYSPQDTEEESKKIQDGAIESAIYFWNTRV